MDYEKKYKEALERARKWYLASDTDKMLPSYTNRIVKEIFPELSLSKEVSLNKKK